MTKDVFVVTTDRGFTESFDERTINTLLQLGLITFDHQGYAIEDSHGNGVGPMHRYYVPAKSKGLRKVKPQPRPSRGSL